MLFLANGEDPVPPHAHAQDRIDRQHEMALAGPAGLAIAVSGRVDPQRAVVMTESQPRLLPDQGRGLRVKRPQTRSWMSSASAANGWLTGQWWDWGYTRQSISTPAAHGL